MADNSTTNTTQTFRTLDDGAAKWPANALAYPTTIANGGNVLQLVDETHGLPVAIIGTVPVSGTFWQATQPVSGPLTNTELRATAVPVSLAAETTKVIGTVNISASQSVALAAGSNSIGKLAANAGVTIGAVEIAASQTIAVTNTGTFAVQAAQSGTWTVGLSAAQTLATVTTVGTVTTITNVVHVDDNGGALTVDNGGTFAVQPGPSTSGGCSTYTFLSTNAVQTAQIKGSAGQVYSLQFFNNSASLRYVRLYNQTGAPASTDTANIVWRGLIPASTSGAGHVVSFPMGIAFSTGIGIRVTGAIADNDATVLTGNDVTGNVQYK